MGEKLSKRQAEEESAAPTRAPDEGKGLETSRKEQEERKEGGETGTEQQPSTSQESTQQQGARRKTYPTVTPREATQSLLADISGFVYHEPDVIKQIRNTMNELKELGTKLENAKDNITTSSDDLLKTYSSTISLFRENQKTDETLGRAVKKLEENLELQDNVTTGFMDAADGLCKRINRLSVEIDRITVPVLGKNRGL